MFLNHTLNKAVCVRHMAAESEYDVFSVYRDRTEVKQQGILQLKQIKATSG